MQTIFAAVSPSTRLAGGVRPVSLVLRGNDPYVDVPVLVNGLPYEPELDEVEVLADKDLDWEDYYAYMAENFDDPTFPERMEDMHDRVCGHITRERGNARIAVSYLTLPDGVSLTSRSSAWTLALAALFVGMTAGFTNTLDDPQIWGLVGRTARPYVR